MRLLFLRYKVLVIFAAFFCFNLLVRIDTLDRPFNDRLSYRQGDTYSMAYLISTGQTDVFHPKYFQAQEHWNIWHYYLAEFPYYQWIVAGLMNLFGEYVLIARLVNIVAFSVLSVVMYKLGEHMFSRWHGIIAAGFLSWFPVGYFWARAITPDILALTTLSFSIYCLVDKRIPQRLLIGSIFYALTLIVKPFYLVFLSIYFLYFLQQHCRFSRKLLQFFLFALVPLTVMIAWRLWILSFPEHARSDPDFATLMHDGLGYSLFYKQTNWFNYFFTTYFFGELLTTLGGIFSVFGFATLVNSGDLKRFKWIIPVWALCSFLITALVARGSQAHDYYSLHWIPVCAVLSSIAVIKIWDCIRNVIKIYILRNRSSLSADQFWGRVLTVIFACGIIIFMVYHLGVSQLFYYRNGYLENSTYHNDDMLSDYSDVSEHIPSDAEVLLLLPKVETYPLNMIKRFGYVLAVPYDEKCESYDVFVEHFRYYRDIHVNWLMVYNGEEHACSSQYSEYLRVFGLDLVFIGKVFNVYLLKEP